MQVSAISVAVASGDAISSAFACVNPRQIAVAVGSPGTLTSCQVFLLGSVDGVLYSRVRDPFTGAAFAWNVAAGSAAATIGPHLQGFTSAKFEMSVAQTAPRIFTVLEKP